MLTLAFYEVLSSLIINDTMPQDFKNSFVFDVIFCTLFSLTSSVISDTLALLPSFRKLTFIHQARYCFSILALNTLAAFIYGHVYDYFFPSSSTSMFWGSIYMFCFIGTMLTVIYTTYHYCIIVVNQNSQLAELQKKALKNQLDPHFVFNSLSSLAELIHQDPDRAESYVIRVSRAFRFLLSHIEDDYSNLSESIKVIKDYAAIQQIRLQGKLELDINVDHYTNDEYLYVMCLQLLVENAIKHNQPEENETLRIYILREGNEIIVRNKIKQGAKSSVKSPVSFGIGLRALTRRYEIDNQPLPVIKNDGEWYEVRISIIQLNKNRQEKPTTTLSMLL